jgi:hypothetical protein
VWNVGSHWTLHAARGNGVAVMAAFKRKYVSGKVVCRYMFRAPGATAEDRRLVAASGFATMREAEDAEAIRRAQELQKYELANKRGLAKSQQSSPPRSRCCCRSSSISKAASALVVAADEGPLNRIGHCGSQILELG